MAATVVLNKATAVKTISGNPPTELYYPEAAGTQAFKQGELVVLVAGAVTEIGDDPALIAGMAAQDASGVTGTPIPIIIANDDVLFELNKVSNSSTAGTGGTGVATAITDVGKEFCIYRDTTHNITHAGQGAVGKLLCVGLSDKDVVADVGGRILCVVQGRWRQLFSTS
jgi:hypothetical protein